MALLAIAGGAARPPAPRLALKLEEPQKQALQVWGAALATRDGQLGGGRRRERLAHVSLCVLELPERFALEPRPLRLLGRGVAHPSYPFANPSRAPLRLDIRLRHYTATLTSRPT